MLNNKPPQWLTKSIYFSSSQVCKSAERTLISGCGFPRLVEKSLCFTLPNVVFQADGWLCFCNLKLPFITFGFRVSNEKSIKILIVLYTFSSLATSKIFLFITVFTSMIMMWPAVVFVFISTWLWGCERVPNRSG